ncbi:hypothetical protein NMY22_g14649 [Coprinellus aureogranulatus]|nr:hypothetical protein NMY22_g14649 [Coprinellus aureogranulatus]
MAYHDRKDAALFKTQHWRTGVVFARDGAIKKAFKGHPAEQLLSSILKYSSKAMSQWVDSRNNTPHKTNSKRWTNAELFDPRPCPQEDDDQDCPNPDRYQLFRTEKTHTLEKNVIGPILKVLFTWKILDWYAFRDDTIREAFPDPYPRARISTWPFPPNRWYLLHINKLTSDAARLLDILLKDPNFAQDGDTVAIDDVVETGRPAAISAARKKREAQIICRLARACYLHGASHKAWKIVRNFELAALHLNLLLHGRMDDIPTNPTKAVLSKLFTGDFAQHMTDLDPKEIANSLSGPLHTVFLIDPIRLLAPRSLADSPNLEEFLITNKCMGSDRPDALANFNNALIDLVHQIARGEYIGTEIAQQIADLVEEHRHLGTFKPNDRFYVPTQPMLPMSCNSPTLDQDVYTPVQINGGSRSRAQEEDQDPLKDKPEDDPNDSQDDDDSQEDQVAGNVPPKVQIRHNSPVDDNTALPKVDQVQENQDDDRDEERSDEEDVDELLREDEDLTTTAHTVQDTPNDAPLNRHDDVDNPVIVDLESADVAVPVSDADAYAEGNGIGHAVDDHEAVNVDEVKVNPDAFAFGRQTLLLDHGQQADNDDDDNQSDVYDMLVDDGDGGDSPALQEGATGLLVQDDTIPVPTMSLSPFLPGSLKRIAENAARDASPKRIRLQSPAQTTPPPTQEHLVPSTPRMNAQAVPYPTPSSVHPVPRQPHVALALNDGPRLRPAQPLKMTACVWPWVRNSFADLSGHNPRLQPYVATQTPESKPLHLSNEVRVYDADKNAYDCTFAHVDQKAIEHWNELSPLAWHSPTPYSNDSAVVCILSSDFKSSILTLPRLYQASPVYDQSAHLEDPAGLCDPHHLCVTEDRRPLLLIHRVHDDMQQLVEGELHRYASRYLRMAPSLPYHSTWHSWAIVMNSNVVLPFDMDDGGYNVKMTVQSGLVLCVLAYDRLDSTSASTFMHPQTPSQNVTSRDYRSIVLSSGDIAVFPAGSIRKMFSLQPTLCHSVRFHDWSTMRNTLHALVHSLVRYEDTRSHDDPNIWVRGIVQRMALLYAEVDEGASLRLPPMNDNHDSLELAAFFCIVELIAVLNPNSYRPQPFLCDGHQGSYRKLDTEVYREMDEESYRQLEERCINVVEPDVRTSIVWARGLGRHLRQSYTSKHDAQFSFDLLIFRPMLAWTIFQIRRLFRTRFGAPGQESIHPGYQLWRHRSAFAVLYSQLDSLMDGVSSQTIKQLQDEYDNKYEHPSTLHPPDLPACPSGLKLVGKPGGTFFPSFSSDWRHLQEGLLTCDEHHYRDTDHHRLYA